MGLQYESCRFNKEVVGMKLTKINVLLLILFSILFILQIIFATTTGCPGGLGCWGISGDFTELHFNKSYVLLQLIITSIILGISAGVYFITHKINNEKTKEQLLKLGLTIFFILYVILSVLLFFFLGLIKQ